MSKMTEMKECVRTYPTLYMVPLEHQQPRKGSDPKSWKPSPNQIHRQRLVWIMMSQLEWVL